MIKPSGQHDAIDALLFRNPIATKCINIILMSLLERAHNAILASLINIYFLCSIIIRDHQSNDSVYTEHYRVPYFIKSPYLSSSLRGEHPEKHFICKSFGTCLLNSSWLVKIFMTTDSSSSYVDCVLLCATESWFSSDSSQVQTKSTCWILDNLNALTNSLLMMMNLNIQILWSSFPFKHWSGHSDHQEFLKEQHRQAWTWDCSRTGIIIS